MRLAVKANMASKYFIARFSRVIAFCSIFRNKTTKAGEGVATGTRRHSTKQLYFNAHHAMEDLCLS